MAELRETDNLAKDYIISNYGLDFYNWLKPTMDKEIPEISEENWKNINNFETYESKDYCTKLFLKSWYMKFKEECI